MRTDEPPVLPESPAERERIAERIADHLDGPLTVAGIVFALVVLADITLPLRGWVRELFDAVGWVLWALFVVEYVTRLVIAPSATAYLRRTWWQLFFLAVPFLRFLRPLARLRVPRVGRVLSSAIRTSRTAARRLSGRLAWLVALTLIVVLSASQIAFTFGSYDSYLEALHDATLAAITGEPLAQEVAVIEILEVVLAIYSVVVFAALAGSLGAFFLERETASSAGRQQPPVPTPTPGRARRSAGDRTASR